MREESGLEQFLHSPLTSWKIAGLITRALRKRVWYGLLDRVVWKFTTSAWFFTGDSVLSLSYTGVITVVFSFATLITRIIKWSC